MIVKNVTFYIKAEYVDEFIAATIENQNNSRKEEGIAHFEFFKSEENPQKFLLYEVYTTEEAVEKHLETEHFKKWIETVEGYFEKPRDRQVYVPITDII
ncbi:antibiotic biosynthesis monooxygenase [Clostridium sp. 19966]|uniref:putative quinol monooxygenase n=1 Tax=Clostridium sp. 19966 TaxID=2768166 RepID=UPI0028DFBEA3|nr:putative quinol monooxygenase [Clostridium sp. 19966]MDT8716937.1 antibiotic biosynthesis monooxygenase [Clostridium sp. 19966]